MTKPFSLHCSCLPPTPRARLCSRIARALGGCLLSFSACTLALGQQTETLRRSEWQPPMSAEQVLALSGVTNILQQFTETEGIAIEIRYPGGEFGQQWSQSLHDWLVTLGIPKQHLTRIPGSGAGEQLVLALTDRNNPQRASKRRRSRKDTNNGTHEK